MQPGKISQLEMLALASDRFYPLQMLAAAFSLASVAGLAVLLRSQKPLSVRLVLAAVLYNGMSGLLIALIWWNQYSNTNIYFLLGVSGLAGMGVVNLTDFVLQLVAGGGLKINMTGDKGTPKEPDK